MSDSKLSYPEKLYETEHLEDKTDIHIKDYESTGRNLDSIEDTKPGSFVWLCAGATAIGGMLFGAATTNSCWMTRLY